MTFRINTSLVVSVEPTIEPVTPEEARSHLRNTEDGDTTYIEALITSARQWVENFLGRQLINATYVKRYDAALFPEWFQLERPPLVSVSSVAYIDTDGASQTVSSSVYTEDTASQPGRIVLAFNQAWPAIRNVVQSITITYVAGYGTAASSVPLQIRQAMLIVLANWNENRESTISGTIIAKVPLSVESMLWPYRMVPFN